jgi:CubicO group peptidase (beta-lactamase class C family)
MVLIGYLSPGGNLLIAKILTGFFLINSALASAQPHYHGNFVMSAPPSRECDDFVNFATQGIQDFRYVGDDQLPIAPLQTHSIQVLHNDQKTFEWHNGVFGPENSHALWSASKDLLATLLARTIQMNRQYTAVVDGALVVKPVTLQTPIVDFYRQDPLYTRLQGKNRAYFEKVTIENLIEMTSGFAWREYYDDDVSHSTFLPMLYLQGQKDMAQFALAQPFVDPGPGKIWNYSGGNLLILSAILEKIYGADYKDLPWTLLGEPLGLPRSALRFERDGKNHFVGSSYAYATIEAMARIGQLFLHHGVWQGQQLLPKDWISTALQVNPAVRLASTPFDYILKEGAPGRRIFWINQNIVREDGRVYRQEHPQAPTDFFFAAGHYGQLIIMVPSEHLVIVRTGNDDPYWAAVQPLVVKALQCFRPGYQPRPVATLVPPSAHPTKGNLARIPDLAASLTYNVGHSLLPRLVAKELCSFAFTQGLVDAGHGRERNQLLSLYEQMGGVSSTLFSLTRNLDEISINYEDHSVSVGWTPVLNLLPFVLDPGVYLQRERAVLQQDPSYGCTLQ